MASGKGRHFVTGERVWWEEGRRQSGNPRDAADGDYAAVTSEVDRWSMRRACRFP